MNRYYVYNYFKDKFMTFLSEMSMDEIERKSFRNILTGHIFISNDLQEVIGYRKEYLEYQIKYFFKCLYILYPRTKNWYNFNELYSMLNGEARYSRHLKKIYCKLNNNKYILN